LNIINGGNLGLKFQKEFLKVTLLASMVNKKHAQERKYECLSTRPCSFQFVGFGPGYSSDGFMDAYSSVNSSIILI
jgi:hypothetical protein